MATDVQYAKKFGRSVSEIDKAQAETAPNVASIARRLGLSHRETLAVLIDKPTTVGVAPTAVVATPTVAGTASVAFTPGASGGTPITGYEITPSAGAVFTTTQITSPIVVSGVTAGAGRTFTVKSINDIGKSAASTASAGVAIT
jgi:hypothetical protein